MIGAIQEVGFFIVHSLLLLCQILLDVTLAKTTGQTESGIGRLMQLPFNKLLQIVAKVRRNKQTASLSSRTPFSLFTFY